MHLILSHHELIVKSPGTWEDWEIRGLTVVRCVFQRGDQNLNSPSPNPKVSVNHSLCDLSVFSLGATCKASPAHDPTIVD